MYYLISKKTGEIIDQADTLKDIEDLRDMQEWRDTAYNSWSLEKYDIIQK
jgi:hypothetical protein